MPSEITRPLDEGVELSLREYLLRVIYVTGFLKPYGLENPDMPLPEVLVPDTSHFDRRIATIAKELERLRALKPKEAEQEAITQHAAQVAEQAQMNEREAARLQLYQHMIAMVDAWQPPAGAQFASFKEIAKGLLTQDIEPTEAPEIPKKQSGSEWRNGRIALLEHQLAFCQRKRIELLEQAQRDTALLQALIKSTNEEIAPITS